MAKRTSLLALAVAPQSRRENEPNASIRTPPASAARLSGKRPGKYHLGAYFDPADPTAEANRVLAARIRRSHQNLLAKAIGELAAKYDVDKRFGRV